MQRLQPRSAEELASALHDAACAGQRIQLGGTFSKNRMAGPASAGDVTVSTAAMNRVLQYEPRDLTISVEAGMLWADLCSLLEQHRQMIPLDPPYHWVSTVGGVVAANLSGPRRKLYGTARDSVIGMKFITLEGKLVNSGGMVVKNVAGLDMAKLMIGSFGTLAAIASVNFKLAPMPEATRTFVLRFPALEGAMAARDRVVASGLQPAALDILNSAASARVGLKEYCMLLQAGGSSAVLDRYANELGGGVDALAGAAESALWPRIREFTPAFLEQYPDGAVVRYSTVLTGLGDTLARIKGPAIARAGTGVVYGYYEQAGNISMTGCKGAVEFAPERLKPKLDLWPDPGSGFEAMVSIKNLFDPKGLLNRGRLYGRI